MDINAAMRHIFDCFHSEYQPHVHV
uniref:Uncharacterized protein n=1 Tax=Anguilla anguilla TaxID=7936 RepID=A0A0E9UAP5_ANGAN